MTRNKSYLLAWTCVYPLHEIHKECCWRLWIFLWWIEIMPAISKNTRKKYARSHTHKYLHVHVQAWCFHASCAQCKQARAVLPLRNALSRHINRTKWTFLQLLKICKSYCYFRMIQDLIISFRFENPFCKLFCLNLHTDSSYWNKNKLHILWILKTTWKKILFWGFMGLKMNKFSIYNLAKQKKSQIAAANHCLDYLSNAHCQHIDCKYPCVHHCRPRRVTMSSL